MRTGAVVDVPCSGAVADQWRLPAGFRFGVATSGYQIEGDFNGWGQPANNWWTWEAAGRVEPSGSALGFWADERELLDRASRIGCDSFRLSVEWTRCEPRRDELDTGALDRYSAILGACRDRGLEPVVTLHHFAHPAWLGQDFWLSADSPERFGRWVESAVSRLGDSCSTWVTLNELNILAINSYMTGAFPPGRRGDVGAALRALDNMLSAHIIAYDIIRRLQPDATVTTNNSISSIYELDRLTLDVLLSRAKGVDRHDLTPWLVDRRDLYYGVLDGRAPPGRLERLLRRLLAGIVPMDRALPRTVAALHSATNPRPLDVVSIDYYDPVASHHLRRPGRRTAGGRNWSPDQALWDDVVDPAGLTTYCEANRDDELGLWVAENGLCNRVRGGRGFPRLDGWDRIRYLRENLATVADTVEAGLPITGYWHWTIADNYEWGSYEPRFGLFGVDRGGAPRIRDVDSMGADAAGEYARLMTAMRAGDRQSLRRPSRG